MSKSVNVRPWQKIALDAFLEHEHKDFLCVATPGAGKTTFALIASRMVLAGEFGCSKIIVVVPSSHLREQWANAAARLGVLLETDHEEMTNASHGLVTTYQSVASQPDTFRLLSQKSFVIFDEIHHAGDEKSWGQSLLDAFINSPKRLSLSGTPFRSDDVAIPFVRYINDELVVDYNYGYDQALSDGGVVRPIAFHRLDGHMEWIDTDGEFNSFSFSETLNNKRNQERLRSALSPKGQWLSLAIQKAHHHLCEIRTDNPDAGGLVICIDHAHARYIEKQFISLGVVPTVVLSDDVDATKKILQFSNNTSEWIIAVRMVSEGVDIPRLVVGLYATTTTTELFFRQAIGRIVRLSGKTKVATMFIPNDPRLVSHAHQIAQSRIHSLVKDEEEQEDYVKDDIAFDFKTELGASDEQLSMFSVISSTHQHSPSAVLDSLEYDKNDDGHTIDTTIDLELPELPIDLASLSNYEDISKMRNTRTNLRKLNSDIVRVIVALTQSSHAQVNAELNKRSGIKTISKATNEQLQKRLDCANEWVASLHKLRVG